MLTKMDNYNNSSETVSEELAMLRIEYEKLQQKCTELEKMVQIPVKNGDSFASRILKTVSELCGQAQYSDLTIKLKSSVKPAHKFVLLARNQNWGVGSLKDFDVLDWSDVPDEVAFQLLKWTYTDELDFTNEFSVLSLMKLATNFGLRDVAKLCEGHLISTVAKSNCVKSYMMAMEINSPDLKEHCYNLITSHWDDFTKYDSKHKDEDGLTPLACALNQKHFDFALSLVKSGADVNSIDHSGQPLLNKFIQEKNIEAVLFLIDHNTNLNFSIQHKSLPSPLFLALENRLPEVVEALCKKGIDMSVVNSNGDSILWNALELPNFGTEIASILVRYGIDTDCWHEGPEGCSQSLLHRSLDENREDFACFLIEAGCDVNSPRKPGNDGKGGAEARDLASPLHLCAMWGLSITTVTLLKHGALVNAKDNDGNTPLHISIQNHQYEITNLLVRQESTDLTIRNKAGHSPFSCALIYKNNKAAQTILTRFPGAAEQHNTKGRNFLHVAIEGKDLESVMFLLSIKVDINGRTKDSQQLSPLHLAVMAESELLVRNLLLAGSHINERTTDRKYTALLIAAEKGNALITSVLLSNDVDFTAVDTEHNNALNIAAKYGNFQVCKVLLMESNIDAESGNLKGQNPLHLLARFGKENAVEIFKLFLECMPNYPINKPDVDGNTALLLAYINGNGELCRALVKAKACLGSMNKDGITIFNYQVPTKQLLYRLLDHLTEEPPWSEGDICLECGTKFSITLRKHHCRHCGRILCSSCSCKDIPIIKFNLNKPVRVCCLCFDVLSLGGAII